MHVIVGGRLLSSSNSCVKKTKLASNFGEEPENVCIVANICVSFVFSGTESGGVRAVYHTHNGAKSQSRVPKALQCLEHLYAGLRIMMNICARFTLLPAEGTARMSV